MSVELDPKVDEEPTTADLAIREQTLAEKEQTERSAEEEEALGVSEARVKKYWKAKEDSRISPRGEFGWVDWDEIGVLTKISASGGHDAA